MIVAPKISEEDARQIFSRSQSFFFIKSLKKPYPPKKTELLYLPFYLFDILLQEDDVEKKVTVSVDGLLGNTLFFLKNDLDYVSDMDGPRCPFLLTQPEAEKIALDKYKWLLLEHGLKKKVKFSVEEITEVRTIHYPFWVGYFKKKKAYDFKVLDGVSGEIQGVKMRRVFLRAFRTLFNLTYS